MVKATAPASGTTLVIFLVVVILSVAGGLIFYSRPKSTGPLPPVLETATGRMVLVPGGRFLHGQNKETAIVPDFYIDTTEVSNAAYAKFCAATSHSLPSGFPSGQPKEPVVNVTIADATAFAKWAGKRLPDALEWEKAARSDDGRTYPWGNESHPIRANVADFSEAPHRPVAVDSMHLAASPYRVLHLVGNVSEFVRNDVTPSREAIERFQAILNPPPAKNEPWFSVKGGSFEQPLTQGIVWEWTPVPARFHAPDIGFRCVKDAR